MFRDNVIELVFLDNYELFINRKRVLKTWITKDGLFRMRVLVANKKRTVS